jgi:hypothetical protein
LPWSLALIEKYEDKWCWKWLSVNGGLPWSLALIEKYEDKKGGYELSKNEVLPFSLELEDEFSWGRFEKKLNSFNWRDLSENIAMDIRVNR